MSGLPNDSSDSSPGGLAIVLFVFFSLAFALAIGGQAILARLFEQPILEGEKFDPTPVVDLIQPEPNFAPDEVVAMQIEGLEKPSISAGIQQCFAFASPDNKEVTGPLERFAAMVRTPPYDVLMRHHLVLIGQPILEREKASVMVTLLDHHDQIRVFQFLLSKQVGEAFKNCWMTDAVYPLQQSPSQKQPEIPEAADSIRSSAHNEYDREDIGLNRGPHG